MWLRRFASAGLILLALAGSMTAASAQQAVPATFTFRGSGFGHGVGMSQYGAKTQAEAGRDAAAIIGHYYSGSRVEGANDLVPLRVNLVSAAPSAEVRGEVLAAGGGGLRVSTGGIVVGTGAGEALTLRAAGDRVVVERRGAVAAQGNSAIVEWANANTLFNVAGPGETLDGRGHRYRHGAADVTVVNGASTSSSSWRSTTFTSAG